MKNYDKNTESSFLEILNANNLYGWAMFQKLPVNGFKRVENLSEFNENFIKKYDKNSNTGYFLEVDVEYPKDLSNSHKDLPFQPERQKIEKVEKLVCDTNGKEKKCHSLRAFKQALNYRIKLKEVHRVIQFNQKA